MEKHSARLHHIPKSSEHRRKIVAFDYECKVLLLSICRLHARPVHPKESAYKSVEIEQATYGCQRDNTCLVLQYRLRLKLGFFKIALLRTVAELLMGMKHTLIAQVYFEQYNCVLQRSLVQQLARVIGR